MKFKKKKTWINPEQYSRILKMLLSENEDDFNIGVELLDKHNIRPSRLLNRNSKEVIESNFNFTVDKGKLRRNNKFLLSNFKVFTNGRHY